MGGDYTVSSSCTFANTVDGVDEGGITINSGVTLTVNAGQTIVWSPGHSIIINGSIAIANGGQLKQTYLWVTDSDNDGYPSSTTMVAQDTAPAGGKRRSAITAFTYVTDATGVNAMKLDYDDSNDSIYPGTTCNGDCSYNDDNGNCVAKPAGENGLPACQRCDGTHMTHVNISTFADSEGTNTCAGTCAGYCSNGSCVSTDTGDGTCNTSDGTRVASGGDGKCSSGTCVALWSCGQPFTDSRDGKTYDTVQIGNQCWMAENLNYATSNSYCYNNNASYCTTYGRLYTWSAAMQGAAGSSANPSGVQGVCPTGWHLPSKAEWDELLNYLGGVYSDTTGGKMKETGTVHWNPPNTGATNSSGFTALPGGYWVASADSFNNIGNYAFFWSCTPYSWEGYSYCYRLDYNKASVKEESNGNENGFSVRCIKD